MNNLNTIGGGAKAVIEKLPAAFRRLPTSAHHPTVFPCQGK